MPQSLNQNLFKVGNKFNGKKKGNMPFSKSNNGYPFFNTKNKPVIKDNKTKEQKSN